MCIRNKYQIYPVMLCLFNQEYKGRAIKKSHGYFPHLYVYINLNEKGKPAVSYIYFERLWVVMIIYLLLTCTYTTSISIALF